MKTAQEVVNDVCFPFQAWRDDTVHLAKQPSALPIKPTWRIPPEDMYKINCDGAFIPGSNSAGWGYVIRNHFGEVVVAGAGSENCLSAQHAEATACLKGLELEQAAALGMDRVILETDAATVAKALSDPTTDRSVIGILIAEIKTQMFYEFSACIISHVPRVCNVVAHTLAALGLNCREGPLIVWQDHVPDSVALLVAGDLAGSRD
jgi:ribonuclease HI